MVFRGSLPDDDFAEAILWLALGAVLAGFKVADALATSGNAISVPSLETPVDPNVAFFTIALGSNLPA